VRCGHFLQRIHCNLLRCINDIIQNVRIVKRFAWPIVARKRDPREPPALAMLAALRNSLRGLAVEEAKPSRPCVVFGIANNFLDR
jgi:hypothetical protein